MVLFTDEKGFETITHICLNAGIDLNKKALDKEREGKWFVIKHWACVT